MTRQARIFFDAPLKLGMSIRKKLYYYFFFLISYAKYGHFRKDDAVGSKKEIIEILIYQHLCFNYEVLDIINL